MGSYLNPGNFSFRGSLRSKIYVDKSKLIAKTNEVLCTEQKYICVSRPRRFGKSMAANMLAAYYDRSENTEDLFQNLAISGEKSYEENLNQYDVIKINMQEFLSMAGTIEKMLEMLKDYLVVDFEEAKTWYDGYQLVAHRQWKDECYSMYNPKSVVEAMLRHKFGTYWNQTETYEALKIYIQMDMDGLKASVIRMLTGDSVPINTGTFSNDMTTFATKDDVLTLLVHLGYLTYNSIDGTVSIPNKEVSQEYINAISTMNWHGVADSVEASRKLLEALWQMDADAVAAGIEKAHEEISIMCY